MAEPDPAEEFEIDDDEDEGEEEDDGDLFPDDELENADWTKTTWDLPPYKSPEFNEMFPDLAAFRKLPAYRNAVATGLIVNDEWTGRTADGTPVD